VAYLRALVADDEFSAVPADAAHLVVRVLGFLQMFVRDGRRGHRRGARGRGHVVIIVR